MFLEKNGFKWEGTTATSRESTINTRFPITVNMGRKKYGHMGNTTCAAAAETSKALIFPEDFLTLFEIISSVIIV